MIPGQKIPIILASTSPRRIDLMNEVYLKVEVLKPTSDEKPKPRERSEKLVARLAQEKAESTRAAALQKYQESIILAADTLVVAPGNLRILGKPRNKDDAREMLRADSVRKQSD